MSAASDTFIPIEGLWLDDRPDHCKALPIGCVSSFLVECRLRGHRHLSNGFPRSILCGRVWLGIVPEHCRI